MDYTRVAERLQSILESARIVVWEWDLATQQVRWSDNAPVTIGIRYKAMADFSNRIHEEDRESRQRALLQALANHSDYEAEFRFLKPDGNRIWLRERGQVTLRE